MYILKARPIIYPSLPIEWLIAWRTIFMEETMLKPWIEYKGENDWHDYALQVVDAMRIQDSIVRNALISRLTYDVTYDDAGLTLFEAIKEYAPNLMSKVFPANPEPEVKRNIWPGDGQSSL